MRERIQGLIVKVLDLDELNLLEPKKLLDREFRLFKVCPNGDDIVF
jgi:hypothetical protein